MKILKAFVLGSYGPDPAVLADFGLPMPGSGGPKTVAAKAQSVAQALATRKARGTKGPKQRLAVKGVVAPVATSAAPAPAVSTASVASTAAAAAAPPR